MTAKGIGTYQKVILCVYILGKAKGKNIYCQVMHFFLNREEVGCYNESLTDGIDLKIKQPNEEKNNRTKKLNESQSSDKKTF